MNENLPTNVQLDSSQNGSVTFATDVLATIAGLAATEVEGVASMFGSPGLADILSRKGQTRNLTRGVKIEVENDQVGVDIAIVVDFGSPIPEVAYNIQENVKKAIETMSGMMVAHVDVHVQGVSFEKENKSAAEIETHQRKMLQKEQEPQKDEPVQPANVANEEDDEFELHLEDDAQDLADDLDEDGADA